MSQDFAAAIICVRDLARCISDAGKLKYPIPLSPVIHFCEQNIGNGFKIEVECRDWKSGEFRSILLRYKTRAKISYSKSLNTCWSRFSICKELAHLATDDPEEFTTAYSALVPLLVSDVGPIPKEMQSPIISEGLTYLIALEMLLPWQLRGEIQAMHESGQTDYEIAKHCMVPEQVVATALHSSYTEISHRFNDAYEKNLGKDWSADGLAGI